MPKEISFKTRNIETYSPSRATSSFIYNMPTRLIIPQLASSLVTVWTRIDSSIPVWHVVILVLSRIILSCIRRRSHAVWWHPSRVIGRHLIVVVGRHLIVAVGRRLIISVRWPRIPVVARLGIILVVWWTHVGRPHWSPVRT
ncbi:hypothetical protein TB2_030469 [Malus domestica]